MMERAMKSREPTCAVIALVIFLGLAAGSACGADFAPDSLTGLCEYGITLALSGREDTAESVFVSLLSRSPGNALALNNLGNLQLWRGDAELALAFYARAGLVDSTDPGIMLNEAVALAMISDEAAESRAHEAVSRAGGAEAAAQLLGLRYSDGGADETSRGAGRPPLTREDVLALLRAAVRAVPADTARAVVPSELPRPPKQVPTFRSAGARAGFDTAPVVYWKR